MAPVKLLSSPDGGALVRVIAGEVAGHSGPGVTYTPISLLHATWPLGPSSGCPGGPTSTPWCTSWPGQGRSGPGASRSAGRLAVYGPGDVVTVEAAGAQGGAAPGWTC